MKEICECIVNQLNYYNDCNFRYLLFEDNILIKENSDYELWVRIFRDGDKYRVEVSYRVGAVYSESFKVSMSNPEPVVISLDEISSYILRSMEPLARFCGSKALYWSYQDYMLGYGSKYHVDIMSEFNHLADQIPKIKVEHRDLDSCPF